VLAVVDAGSVVLVVVDAGSVVLVVVVAEVVFGSGKELGAAACRVGKAVLGAGFVVVAAGVDDVVVSSTAAAVVTEQASVTAKKFWHLPRPAGRHKHTTP